ncbi:MAG TPA: aminotransferase class V-fold PLP-dependent enzyme [Firmicutes bacterium]|nr:aminotransferase class V-fold PLP-dependent enzyme [Bacillota bacterium]
MARIYLDNAATAYPKAPGVGEAMCSFIENIGSNVNRSGYSSSLAAEEIVFETRELICELFNFHRPENVIFTLNVTYGLNILLKGLLKPGDHCLASSLEHNAVMRPLMQLKTQGVEFSKINCDATGRFDPKSLVDYKKANTKAVIVTHASNVTGTILPLAAIGQFCAENNLIFIVDAAQTAGCVELDFGKIKADAVGFTGHKGLLGPQGIGGFLISEKLAGEIEPLICGGTGSFSEYEEQPAYLPDKFEAGTPNIPGIYGLRAALKYIEKTGADFIGQRELELAAILLEGFANLPGVHIAGPKDLSCRTAVISVDFKGFDNAEIAHGLAKQYGIQTRCGLHCAPSAHRVLGTFPHGTVRFSPGHFNTKEEMEKTLQAVSELLKS